MGKVVSDNVYLLQQLFVCIAFDLVIWGNLFQKLLIVQFWQEGQRPSDILGWTAEYSEFFRVVEVWAPYQLLEEHVEVEATLINQVLVLVVPFLARHRRNIKSWKPLAERRPQLIELFVSSRDLERSHLIDTNSSVDNKVSFGCLVWVTDTELHGEFVVIIRLDDFYLIRFVLV